jgi:hypothetical protein
MRGNGIERITPDMLNILTCIVTVPMARTAPGALPVVAFSHIEVCWFFDFVEMREDEMRCTKGSEQSPPQSENS